VIRGLYFASGVIFGVVLTCAACTTSPSYPNNAFGPAPGGPGYYGGPPPAGHPEVSRAMNELQHARYVLQAQAASDYRGHKATRSNTSTTLSTSSKSACRCRSYCRLR